MAAAIPFVTLLSAGLGAASTIKGFRDSRKEAPKPEPLPTAPTEQDAQKNAAAELQRRKRASVLSGGQTDLTRGTATLQAGQVGQKTLLGA